MKRFLLIVAALCAASALYAAEWTVYRVHVPNNAAAQRLADSDVALLSCQIGSVTEVAAPDDSKLRKLGMRYQIVGKISDTNLFPEGQVDGSDYRTQYLQYDAIIAQYEQWRSQYPTIVTREQIGTSIQGRAIWVYRLRNPYAVIPPSGVMIQGGIHAREWLTAPTVMYITDMLLQDGLNSGTGWELLTRYEISIIPHVNPDGYQYSWTQGNRLWRKNRRDNPNSSSFGVDLNRNYSKGWGGQGSSGFPSSDTYRGTAAFSEPEVSCIRDYLNDRSTTVPYVLSIDYHTHGEYILYPWSYTENAAPHSVQLNAVGNMYRSGMLASGGHDYLVGQGSTALYIAGGTSKDFYYDQYGAMTYTVEMRSGGQTGFDPPPSAILPNAMENYAGFKAVLLGML